MKNPCYDSATKTDCPERCAGCGATCDKWKKYEESKKEIYKDRIIQSAVNGYEVNRRQRIRKTLGKSIKQN